jgi:hypothetical protein
MRSSSEVCDDIPTKSDHFITKTKVDLSPPRILASRRDWNNANAQKLQKLVRGGLEKMQKMPMRTPSELDNWLEALMDVLCKAEESVPFLPAHQHSIV